MLVFPVPTRPSTSVFSPPLCRVCDFAGQPAQAYAVEGGQGYQQPYAPQQPYGTQPQAYGQVRGFRIRGYRNRSLIVLPCRMSMMEKVGGKLHEGLGDVSSSFEGGQALYECLTWKKLWKS